MRTFSRLLLCLILFISLSSFLFAAAPAEGEGEEVAPAEDGGGEESRPRTLKRATGPGTEAVYFDDNSLLFDPTPTMTPIAYFPKKEIEAWDLLRDTKHLLVRCNQYTKIYEKQLRKKMDNGLLEMGKSTASMHTKALLHDRDKLEHIWEQQVEKNLNVLEVARLQAEEFHEDWNTMVKNQKATEHIFINYNHKLQKMDELVKKFDMNEAELFFTKKKIDKFVDLFNVYVQKFNKESKRKETQVEKLITEHHELHKP